MPFPVQSHLEAGRITTGAQHQITLFFNEGTLGILDILRDPLGTLRNSEGFLGNPGGWFLKGVSWDGSATVQTEI